MGIELLIIGPIIWLFCGVVSMLIANNKNRSGCLWFLLGLLLGPLAFVVALLPLCGPYSRSSPQVRRSTRNGMNLVSDERIDDINKLGLLGLQDSGEDIIDLTDMVTGQSDGQIPAVEETKKCPFCAETIKLEAIKCRYCGEWLDLSHD